MSDVACTAVDRDDVDGQRPNILFTPPCACPRCRPEPVVAGRPDRNWLRLPGDRQRHRVEPVALGDVGRLALG